MLAVNLSRPSGRYMGCMLAASLIWSNPRTVKGMRL